MIQWSVGSSCEKVTGSNVINVLKGASLQEKKKKKKDRKKQTKKRKETYKLTNYITIITFSLISKNLAHYSLSLTFLIFASFCMIQWRK